MTNTKVNTVTPNGAMPRRGFFGAIAASVAGVVGLGHLVKQPAAGPSAAPDSTPTVSVHPNAVARTEEGSRRHG